MFLFYSANCQQSGLFYLETIKDDSVRMFINEDMKFTGKDCALIIRYTRVNKQRQFDGFFKDVLTDGRVIAKGRYVNGRKHGFFHVYHLNGELLARGKYNNGIPDGRWDLYFDTGLPFRQIQCSEKDTLLVNQFNPKGYPDVIEGNGKFVTYSQFTSKYYNQFIVKGHIKNGRPDGVWTTPYRMSPSYLREKFVDGRLIRGERPNARGNNRYYKSRLTTFFYTFYYDDLEYFTTSDCRK
jgi:hypothetical protein